MADDKITQARALLNQLAGADGTAGISVADLKTMDPHALAQALNVNNRDGLTRKDLEEGVYGYIKNPQQRHAAADSLMKNMNIAFKDSGFVVKEDAQNPRFDVHQFGRQTDFPIVGNDQKIAAFTAFAREGGLENLSKDALQNIHHGYFRAAISSGVQLPESVVSQLTTSQEQSYHKGDRAAFISNYQTGRGVIEGQQGQPRGASFGFSDPAVAAQVEDIREKFAAGNLKTRDLGMGNRAKEYEVIKALDSDHNGRVEQAEVQKALHVTPEESVRIMNALHKVHDSNAQSGGGNVPFNNGPRNGHTRG
jgi:hypothetical protein